jgi:hypothetical protein
MTGHDIASYRVAQLRIGLTARHVTASVR